MGRPARTSAKPNVMGCAAAARPLPRLYVNVAMPTECSRTAPTAASGPEGTAERWSRTGPLARSAAPSPRGTPRVGRCALRRRDGTPCGLGAAATMTARTRWGARSRYGQRRGPRCRLRSPRGGGGAGSTDAATRCAGRSGRRRRGTWRGSRAGWSTGHEQEQRRGRAFSRRSCPGGLLSPLRRPTGVDVSHRRARAAAPAPPAPRGLRPRVEPA